MIDGLRFVNYATIHHDPRWATTADAHAWHEVIAVESGGMVVTMDGETWQGRAGDVYFYRAGHMHQERTDPQYPALTLCLSVAAGEELSAGILFLTHDMQGRVRQLLRWVAEEMPMGLMDHPARVQGLLHALFVELRALAHPRESALVRDILLYIHAHLAEPMTLDQLADHAAMSKYHFLREFQRQTGVTPMAEVRRQRLEQARTLLLSTPWPLRTIASRVGINNEYYLSTLLHKHFGVSARQMRKQ